MLARRMISTMVIVLVVTNCTAAVAQIREEIRCLPADKEIKVLRAQVSIQSQNIKDAYPGSVRVEDIPSRLDSIVRNHGFKTSSGFGQPYDASLSVNIVVRQGVCSSTYVGGFVSGTVTSCDAFQIEGTASIYIDGPFDKSTLHFDNKTLCKQTFTDVADFDSPYINDKARAVVAAVLTEGRNSKLSVEKMLDQLSGRP